MAVEADGRWHRKIDAYHTYRDLGNETLSRISTAREDRNRVALVMVVRVAQRLLERLRTNDLQHGAEDLVLVALHRRRGVIDQGRPQEKALLMARQAPAPPVDDQLGALVDSQLDIAFNLLLVFGGDDWTHLRIGISGDADPQLGNLLHQALANRLGRLLANGHDHRHGHAPLAGGAKGPGEDVPDDLVKISVGQDDPR